MPARVIAQSGEMGKTGAATVAALDTSHLALAKSREVDALLKTANAGLWLIHLSACIATLEATP